MVFPLKPRLTITNRQEARSYFIPFTTIKPLLNHFFGMTWLYNSHWTHCQIVMDPIHSVIIPWRWAMLSRHIVQASARCFSFEDGRENGKFTGRGNGATNNPWAGKSLLIYPTRLLFHSYVSVYQRVSMFMCVYLMFTYAFWISAKKTDLYTMCRISYSFMFCWVLIQHSGGKTTFTSELLTWYSKSMLDKPHGRHCQGPRPGFDAFGVKLLDELSTCLARILSLVSRGSVNDQENAIR